ncbi:unnamed protein product [Merluccius merluccius]
MEGREEGDGTTSGTGSTTSESSLLQPRFNKPQVNRGGKTHRSARYIGGVAIGCAIFDIADIDIADTGCRLSRRYATPTSSWISSREREGLIPVSQRPSYRLAPPLTPSSPTSAWLPDFSPLYPPPPRTSSSSKHLTQDTHHASPTHPAIPHPFPPPPGSPALIPSPAGWA